MNIIALYRQHGYYDVHVAPQTIAAQNAGTKATQHSARIDRVNLVFEIKEGDKRSWCGANPLRRQHGVFDYEAQGRGQDR